MMPKIVEALPAILLAIAIELALIGGILMVMLTRTM